MRYMPLLGILALLYAVLVVFIAAKKPEKMWNMRKIQGFRNVLGEQGTVIFFYVWAVAFAMLGVWLLTK